MSIRSSFLKLSITASAVLLFVNGVQANNPVKSGPYVGAMVGVSQLSGKQNFTAQDNGPPVAPFDNRNNSLSATSPGIGVFGGYGHRVNCTWLAVELSYFFDRLNSDRSATFVNATPDQKTFQSRSTGGALGLAFHLGYIPHENYMVYAIIAAEARRFQLGLVSDANNPANAIVPLSLKRYTSIGFAPGLGMRFSLAKNLALRGEYKVAFHRSKSISATAEQAGTNNTSVLRQNPRVHTFQVGLVYSF